jgi:hypothetical protein
MNKTDIVTRKSSNKFIEWKPRTTKLQRLLKASRKKKRSQLCPLTIGLCDVGVFEIRLPGTAAQLKY